DTAQTVTFSLADDLSLFAIDPVSGEIRVQAGKSLDYETALQHTLTVVATDNGSPAQSTAATVTIFVADANEFSPAASDQIFVVPENAPVGWYIGRIEASDADRY